MLFCVGDIFPNIDFVSRNYFCSCDSVVLNINNMGCIYDRTICVNKTISIFFVP